MKSVKLCPPFLEAMTNGYIIPAPFDFRVEMEQGVTVPKQYFEHENLPGPVDAWTPLLENHPSLQLAGSPWENELILKLRGYWYIKTPPGYSCLFTAPPNRSEEELPFQALSGIVETDMYKSAVHFPVVARRPFPFEVAAGTTLVQVIPFKREDWNLDVRCADDDIRREIAEFDKDYWNPANRKFEEGTDASNPKIGHGAFRKLVKKNPQKFH